MATEKGLAVAPKLGCRAKSRNGDSLTAHSWQVMHFTADNWLCIWHIYELKADNIRGHFVNYSACNESADRFGLVKNNLDKCETGDTMRKYKLCL